MSYSVCPGAFFESILHEVFCFPSRSSYVHPYQKYYEVGINYKDLILPQV